MQTLELNKMGLAPMPEFEMQEIKGGGAAKWCWEVIKTWGAEKVLDATYEYLKNSAPAPDRFKKYSESKYYMHPGKI